MWLRPLGRKSVPCLAGALYSGRGWAEMGRMAADLRKQLTNPKEKIVSRASVRCLFGKSDRAT